MKKLLLIIFITIILLPISIKAETTITLDCSLDNKKAAETITCPLIINSDEELNDITLGFGWTNNYLIFDANSDWKIITSDFNNNNPAIHLQKINNINNNEIGSLTFSAFENLGIYLFKYGEEEPLAEYKKNFNTMDFKLFVNNDIDFDFSNLNNTYNIEVDNNVNELVCGYKGENSLGFNYFISWIIAQSNITVNGVEFDRDTWLQQLREINQEIIIDGKATDKRVEIYEYLPFIKLEEGLNTINMNITENGESANLTFNIYRKEATIEKQNNKVEEKIKESPNTGILLSIILSIISISLILYLYFRYYKKITV